MKPAFELANDDDTPSTEPSTEKNIKRKSILKDTGKMHSTVSENNVNIIFPFDLHHQDESIPKVQNPPKEPPKRVSFARFGRVIKPTIRYIEKC